MSNIPRKSEFDLTDEEKEDIRGSNNERLGKYMNRYNYKSIEGAERQYLIDLYYGIGMEDFWIYQDVNRNRDSTQNVAYHLFCRAKLSAKLQVLLEDMEAQGIDVGSLCDAKAGNIYEVSNPITIYHGTAEPLKTEDIGKPNDEGVYAIRDGVSYWTPRKEVAERFTRPNPEQIGRGIESGTVHARTIMPGESCCEIAETHGGAFAMWQDEIVELSKRGVKYLFSREPGREDIMDVENFADFVQKRDKCLSDTLEKYNFNLPGTHENYTKYIEGMERYRPPKLQQLADKKHNSQKELSEKREDLSKGHHKEGRDSYE